MKPGFHRRSFISEPITEQDYRDSTTDPRHATRKSFYFGQDSGEPHGGKCSLFRRNYEEDCIIHALDGALIPREHTPRDVGGTDRLRALRERINLIGFLGRYYRNKILSSIFTVSSSYVSNAKKRYNTLKPSLPFIKDGSRIPQQTYISQFPHIRYPRPFITPNPHYVKIDRLPARLRQKITLTIHQYFSFRKLYQDGELIPPHEIPYLRN